MSAMDVGDNDVRTDDIFLGEPEEFELGSETTDRALVQEELEVLQPGPSREMENT